MAVPADVTLLILGKIEAGALPVAAPLKMYAGHGSGRPCGACEQPVTPADVEYETDMPDGRTFRFHPACLAAWQAELTRFSQRPS